MIETHFKFQMLHMTNMPVFVILFLKHKEKEYPFSFIFHPREKKEDFLLKYPEAQFPPNNSVEIEICDTPEWLKDKDHEIVHIATNKAWSPLEHYICYYPAPTHEEAIDIAKFWARYNLMNEITSSTSTEKEVVLGFPLDDEIRVFEVR